MVGACTYYLVLCSKPFPNLAAYITNTYYLRNLEEVQLRESSSGTLRRLYSRCWHQLQSSESWLGLENGSHTWLLTEGLSYSCGLLFGGSGPRPQGLSIALLECLPEISSWGGHFPQSEWFKREQGRRRSAFYDLVSNVMLHHFHYIVLVTKSSTLSRRGRLKFKCPLGKGRVPKNMCTYF